MIRTLKVAGLLSAGGLVLLLATSGAHAQPPGITDKEPLVQATSLAGVPYRVVQIADLNLQHPAGMITLRARIKAAVNSVCDAAYVWKTRGVQQVRLARAVSTCREAASQDAFAQVSARTGSVTVAAR